MRWNWRWGMTFRSRHARRRLGENTRFKQPPDRGVWWAPEHTHARSQVAMVLTTPCHRHAVRCTQARRRRAAYVRSTAYATRDLCEAARVLTKQPACGRFLGLRETLLLASAAVKQIASLCAALS